MSKRWDYAAQGLLSGLSSAVDTMFKVQIEKDREARLQAIADKNYKRDRADQLADIKSQREFQKGLLTEQRAYDDQVRNTEFGRQVALQTLGVNAQKALLDYGQQFPQSAIGKLIADRDKFEPGTDQYDIYDRAIQQSQIITNTNPYTGAISLGIPIYENKDGRNELTGVQEVATFGGVGDLGSPSSSVGREPPTPPPSPGINDLDAPAVQDAIDQIESALESGNLRGATKPQLESRLQELRRRLQTLNSQAANPRFNEFQLSFAGRKP